IDDTDPHFNPEYVPPLQQWYSEMALSQRGHFRLTGSINDEVEILEMKLNSVVIFSFVADDGDSYDVNFLFDTTEEENTLEVFVVSAGITNPASLAASFLLRTLSVDDEDGNPINPLANFDEVDLA